VSLLSDQELSSALIERREILVALFGFKKTWWQRRPPRKSRRCYRTKTDALNALRVQNQALIDEHLIDADPGDWDAIEARYGGRVRDVYAAMAKAMPGKCIDEFDLDTFRDTEAMRTAEDAGARFTLTDRAQDFLAERDQKRVWIETGVVDQCYTITPRQKRLPFKAIKRRRMRICRDASGRFEACETRSRSVELPEAPF